MRSHLFRCPIVCFFIFFAFFACGVDEVGFPPPVDRAYYPLGLATHPDGRYLYVSNAVYDRKYNASTITVLDTYTQQYLPNATVKMGLFSGEIAIIKRACTDVARCERDYQTFAFTSSRDQNSLIALEVNAELADSPRHLNCGQESALQNNPQSDRSCQGRHVITQGRTNVLPKNPFSIAVDDEGLFLTHLNPGSVSRWRFAPLSDDATGIPIYDCEINYNGILAVATHPVLASAFLSNRNSPQVVISEVYPTLQGRCNLQLKTGPQTVLSRVASDTRGIAFSADGSLLYLANDSDRSVNIYDTSINSNGDARRRLLKSIPTGNQVNVLRVAGLRPGETRANQVNYQGVAQQVIDQQGQGLIYVSLFDDSRVHVIDPNTLQLIASIEVGRTPHDIAFMPDRQGQLKAYVSNFDQHYISVIDLNPQSPTYLTKINTIR